MCGRYTFIPEGNLEERFNLNTGKLDLRSSYNVSPGAIMPVVVENSHKHLVNMRWGLVPFWSKDPKIGYKMINARSEEIAAKPAFRKPFRTQRCLIPASGFYEWDHNGNAKQPYYFKLKNTDLFSFAGIYDVWLDAEKRPLQTYSILTTSANQLVAKIHNRMPVIIKPQDENIWLNTHEYFPDKLADIMQPYAAAQMTMQSVSTAVNNPQTDSPTNLNSL